MNKKIKNKYLIVTLALGMFFAAGCSYNGLLKQPKNANDKPGGLIFCAYVKDHGALDNGDKMKFARKVGDSFQEIEMPSEGEKINGKTEKNIMGLWSMCHVVTGLPAGDYALVYSYHKWSVEVNTGANSKIIYDYDANLFFNANQSYSEMPIHIIPGKITYLGIKKINIEGNDRSKYKAEISESPDDLGYYSNTYIYGYFKEISKKRAEINMFEGLNSIFKNSNDTYWLPIIETRLKELGES